MRLKSYTDYALRVLMHLAAKPDRLASIGEIARTYRISHNHLMKVVHDLRKQGFLDAVRGRTGGIRLGRPAARSALVRSFGIPRPVSTWSIAAPASSRPPARLPRRCMRHARHSWRCSTAIRSPTWSTIAKRGLPRTAGLVREDRATASRKLA